MFFFPKKRQNIWKRKKIKQKKSFSFLNIRNTRFNQSSPGQPNPKKKILKNLQIFFLYFFLAGKNCYSLSFPILGRRDWTRALQSTCYRQALRTKGQLKILLSNLGLWVNMRWACVNLNHGWKWYDLCVNLNYGCIHDDLCLNLDYELGGTDRETDKQTDWHINTMTGPGRAEWK